MHGYGVVGIGWVAIVFLWLIGLGALFGIVYAAVRLAALHALKAHTRWVNAGQPGAASQNVYPAAQQPYPGYPHQQPAPPGFPGAQPVQPGPQPVYPPQPYPDGRPYPGYPGGQQYSASQGAQPTQPTTPLPPSEPEEPPRRPEA